MGYEARNGQPGRRPIWDGDAPIPAVRRLPADMQLARPHAGKKSRRLTATPWTRKVAKPR